MIEMGINNPIKSDSDCGYPKQLRASKVGFLPFSIPPPTGEVPIEHLSMLQPMSRVTGFYLGAGLKVNELFTHIIARRKKGPRRIDDVLYIPLENNDQGDLSNGGGHEKESVVVCFKFGVIVLWGLGAEEEQHVLKEISLYIEEFIGIKNVFMEDMKYVITSDAQAGISNDVMMLPKVTEDLQLAISYGIAQSAMLSFYEDKITNCIANSRGLSTAMKVHGMVSMNRTDIAKKIGELFDLRIHVNLASSILDVPEFIWTHPTLDPLYRAVREYLEITQRVQVLDKKCSVISDMLEMMREQLNCSHSQKLEWVVIILIFIEIVMAFYGKM